MEPEICFSKYKRRENDDVENGDDDDEFDDVKSDNKNSENFGKYNGTGTGTKFNSNSGK